jgi:N-acetylglucosamine-6-phosphate deacetylase
MKFTEMNLIDAAHAASLMPAQACGVGSRKGSLEAGKDADIAVLHPDFSVSYTIRAGTIAYMREG